MIKYLVAIQTKALIDGTFSAEFVHVVSSKETGAKFLHVVYENVTRSSFLRCQRAQMEVSKWIERAEGDSEQSTPYLYN